MHVQLIRYRGLQCVRVKIISVRKGPQRQQRLVANYAEIRHMYKDSRFFQFLGSDIVRMQTSNSMLA
jgi:hypothetical protein